MKKNLIAGVLALILIGGVFLYKAVQIGETRKTASQTQISIPAIFNANKQTTLASLGIGFDFPPGVYADGLTVKDKYGNTLFELSSDSLAKEIMNSGPYPTTFSAGGSLGEINLSERKIGEIAGIQKTECGEAGCGVSFYFKTPDNTYMVIVLDDVLDGVFGTKYLPLDGVSTYSLKRKDTFDPKLYKQTLDTLHFTK